MKCSLCEDCGWVCESHPDLSWEGKDACTCGGALSAVQRARKAPRLPDGFKTEFDKKGWRH
jgi:hypothetical protein